MSYWGSFEHLSALLVEPSSTQAQFIKLLFARIGVTRVTVVSSGQEALAQMRDEPPSVVVSALYLPDMQGTDLVFAMREDPDLELMPFLLISSETRPQVLDPVRQSGACGILPKPFSDGQLKTALRSVVAAVVGDGSAHISAPVDLESLKVLLVDDSPNARKFMKHVLGNLGMETFLEANDGLEAVSLMSGTLVDLVVTDYNMPEMDGKALVEYIRQQSWQRDVPILMVTSESNMGRLAAVEQAGVSAICDKPFDATNLRQVIERILQREGA